VNRFGKITIVGIFGEIIYFFENWFFKTQPTYLYNLKKI